MTWKYLFSPIIKAIQILKSRLWRKRDLISINIYIQTILKIFPVLLGNYLPPHMIKRKILFFFMHKLICFVIELQVVSGLIIISLQIFLHSSLLCATNSSVHLIGTTYLAWPSFLPRKRAGVIQNLAKLYTMASVARTHTILIADTWKKGWQDPQLVH